MFLAIRRLHVLLAVLTCVTAKVTVEDKAFQNILVSFSQTVEPDDGRSLVLEMQNAISAASHVLQNAVGLKVGSVSFVIPNFWDTSGWENMTVEDASTQHVISSADITIDGIADSAFGKYPFAVQYAGCGIPGEKIRIPKDFLTEESDLPKGNLLAREWLKYRYGVFDENGFPGDSMYPLYERLYGRYGDYKVTSCTDAQVEYKFRMEDGSNCSLHLETGLPEEKQCRVYPTEDSVENVTSSLMFFHENLPNIEHICGDEIHKHDDTSSNKQNILCRGKSIWDVLKLSDDFSAQNNEEEPPVEENHEIKFNYVRERNQRVVVSWESTNPSKDKKEIIFFAIKRFLYDLPGGSEYALHSYQDEVMVHTPLTKLDKYQNVDVVSDFNSPDEACTSCAIGKALEALSSADNETPEKGGTIVIIASTDPGEDENVLKKLQDSQICLLVIAFVDSGASAAGFQKYIEATPCGRVREVPNREDKIEVFEKIYEAMESLLPIKVKDSVTSTVQTGYLRLEQEMEIPVDSTTETVVLGLAEYTALKNIICKQGNIVLSLSVPDQHPNVPSVQFTPKLKTVQAKCSLRHEGSEPVMTQVRSTTKAGEYYEINAWVVDTTEKGSTQQMPVIIYVSLHYGSYPVKGAEVRAVVKPPDGAEVSLLLADDGRGDPDVTADDGVYSRYFTGFNVDGEYTVSITAKDNGQATWGNDGDERCCGSTVNSKSSALGKFEKASQLTFKAISGRPEEGYKPSRISDLRIGKYDSDGIELKWTAPGGEADSGTATRYEFLLFCKNEVCKEDGLLPNWIMVKEKPLPKEYGSAQKAKIELMKTAPLNGTFIISLKSINEYGESSDESNRVRFHLREDVDEIITTKAPEVDDEAKSGTPLDIIVGSVVSILLVIIIIVAVIYVLAAKRRRAKKREMDPEGSATSIEYMNSKTFDALDHKKNDDLMRRAESFPVILYTHDQIKDFKNKKQDPPLYESSPAPKPWMSLDTLPSNKLSKIKKNDEHESVESSSTNNVKDDESTKEMNQLDNISRESAPEPGKVDKF